MMVAMFCRMGIDANLEKTNKIVCMPVFVWEKWLEAEYKQRATGEGATFRERKKTQVSFIECGVTVSESYMKAHME